MRYQRSTSLTCRDIGI